MTRKPAPRRDASEEGGPDPAEDPILYLAEQKKEDEG